MDKIQDLIQHLRTKDIILNYSEGNIEISQLNDIEIEESEINLIKENRQELISYLESLNLLKANSLIPIADIDNDYPLSASQNRLWILSQSERSSVAYNMPFQTELNGEYNILNFQKAVLSVIERHEILRTIFIVSDTDEVRQKVLSVEDLNFAIDFKDYTDKVNPKDYINEYIKKETYQPFDLERGPLLRASLLKESNERYVFYFNLHHIICDGWSLNVLVNDLLNFYNAYEKNEEVNLLDLKNQYKDYAVWQNVKFKNGSFEKHKDFWMNNVSGNQNVIDLPTNKIRPAIMSYSGYSIGAHLPSKLVKTFNSFCSKQGVSRFVGILASWNVFLYRYTSQKDIVIGSPVAGRSHASLENQIGFYVNTVLFRNQIDPSQNFVDFLQKVNQSAIEVFAYQDYPFDKLVDDLNLKNDTSRNKLFDVMLVLQQSHNENKSNFRELILEDKGHRKAKLDIEIICHEASTGLYIEIIFNSDIYEKEMIENLLLDYTQFLDAILTNPEVEIDNVDFLNEKQKHQLLVDFSGKKVDYLFQKTVIDLYKDQLKKNYSHIAVVFEDNKITFKKLDELSDKLAFYLIEKYSIKKNDLIGVELYRSEWMLISILAILKSGAAYVPIDPDYPKFRKEYIKEDSKYITCINQEELDCFNRSNIQAKNSFSLPIIDPNDLAYVIYTSGSTGNPKGVLIDHLGLYNRLRWMIEDLKINEKDVVLQKTPYTFDVSVWEIIIPLITGSKLVFAKPDGHRDPEYLQDIIEREKINIIHFVPSMLGAFLLDVDPEKCLSLRHLICSGESLPVQMVAKFKKILPHIYIHNYYGPTEASIDVTAINLTDIKNLGNSISIGSPVHNTNIYIVNESNVLQPIGVTGELLIGGIQVAQGYLNKSDLNKEKFIESPFVKGEKVYKTGDLAKWLPNGTIEFLGRRDNQVKIRGNRIEIGEIENVLLQSKLIEQSIVLVKNNIDGNQSLVAYILPNKNYDQDILNTFLIGKLPTYMIPNYLIELSEIPVTSNGKIDFSSLPPVDFQDINSKKYIAPRNKVENDLVKIWESILKEQKIGIFDNFFQIGGDSIISIRLISKINRFFDIRLKVDDLYHNQCVAELAILTEKLMNIPLNEDLNRFSVENKIYQLKNDLLINFLEQHNIEDIYPMSDIQKGMVYSSLFNNNNEGIYHDQFVYRLPKIEIDAFEKALSLLVKKHEILRTSFNLQEYSEPIQIVNKDIELKVGYIDLTQMNDLQIEEFIKEYIIAERKRPFNLKEAPLWRCCVFNTGIENDVFVFQFHHAILDGWSVATFNTELFKVYNEIKSNKNVILDSLKFSYKESVIQEILEKENNANRIFWEKELTEYKRLDIFSNTNISSHYLKQYDSTFLRKLKERCKHDNITLRAIFFGAYVFALKMLTYEDDILIGLVSNNRPVVEDGDKILGCFLNTLPARIDLKNFSSFTWIQYFKKIDEKLLDIKSKEGMTLMEMSKMSNERVDDKNPFFDVIFDFIDFHIYDDFGSDSEKKNDYKFVKNQSHEATNTYLDLTLSATGGVLFFDYKLNKALKIDISLEQLHQFLDKILDLYINQSEILISTNDIISNDEKFELIDVLNNHQSSLFNETSVIDVFINQVKKEPNSLALIFGDKKITYKELDDFTNLFSSYLRTDFEISSGDLVGVMLERNEWLIIVIISILKLGAAYIPIDINFPEERKKFIEENSNCKICIDKDKLDSFFKRKEDFSAKLDLTVIKPNDSLYVIYTSGTTGMPKGVIVTHKNLLSFLPNLGSKLNFSGLKRIGVTTNVTFDISVLEILGALCTGKELHLFSDEELNDPFAMMDKINYEKLEILQLTPTRLSQLYSTQMSFPSSLKTVLVGGEAMDASMYDKLKEESFEAINVYGPTETTIWSTALSLKESENLGIGTPLLNEQVYILNSEYSLQPKGVEGEICIGGFGVTNGYLNNDELTEEKFIRSSFKKGEIIYKTGDIGKWLSDGTLYFLGRKDDQVKVHGHRIELAEIENVLARHPEISNVKVLTKDTLLGKNQLLAFFISNEKLEDSSLINFLKQILPQYMIPSHFIQVETMPLTSNGKIDRKLLLTYHKDSNSSKVAYLAARNKIEETLVSIWQDVLQKERIGVYDNFFELGGHSLTAVKIVSEIQSKLDVRIDVSKLFTQLTISDLAIDISNNIWQREEIEEENVSDRVTI